MMTKNKLYSFLLLILAGVVISSCQSDLKEELPEVQTRASVDFDIHYGVEEEDSKLTVLSGEMDLHLFVFDENGLWLGHRKQRLTSGKMSFQLAQSTHPLVLHFAVAQPNALNEWTSADKIKSYQGKEEGEIINQITSATPLFWQRKRVEKLQDKQDLGTIHLLYNRARIYFTNSTNTNRFHLLGFAIHNYPTKGTLAPFDGKSNTFKEGIITEPFPSAYSPFTPMNADGTPQLDDDDVEFIDATHFADVFERVRSHSGSNLYLIIKALYEGELCYYKLGLYDKETLARLDMQRNTAYNFNITSVSTKGYSTIREVIINPPAENAALSVLLEEYPKITDGYTSLEVDKTIYIYNQAHQPFELNYTYKPDPNNPKAVHAVPQVELIQQPGEEVLDIRTYLDQYFVDKETGEVNGKITAKTYWISPQNKTHVAEIRVKFGSLIRKVRIELGPKKKLNARLVKYGDQADDKVVIQLNIPKEDFTNLALFPLFFQVESKYLYPNTEANQNSNLSIISHENGSYLYQYAAKKPGEHQIYMKRTLSDASEVVLLRSDYYRDTELSLTTEKGNQVISLKGNISYGNKEKKPLEAQSIIRVEPSSIPRSLLIYDKGRYRFLVEESKLSSDENVRIKALLNDGTSYQIETKYKELASHSDIHLKPYTIKVASDLYRYLEAYDRFRPLDIRTILLEVEGAEGIQFALHPQASDVSNIEVTIPTDIPNATKISIVAHTGWRMNTTIGELKKGVAIILR